MRPLVHRLDRVLPLSLVVTIAASVLISGCVDSTRTEPGGAKEGGGGNAQAKAGTDPKTAGGTGPGEAEPGTTGAGRAGVDDAAKPKALTDDRADLLKKLEPGIGNSGKREPKKVEPKPPTPSSPEEPKERKQHAARSVSEIGADEAALLKSVEAFAGELAAALTSQDPAKINQLIVSEAELKSVVTDGSYPVLSGMPLAASKRLKEIATAFAGQKTEHEWAPGTLHPTSARLKIWSKEIPMMIGGVLTVDIGGAPLLIRFEQLLYVQNNWRVFRIK